MSNAARLAKILRKLADAHYQAADELGELATEVVANEQPAAGAVPPRATAPADYDDLPGLPSGPARDGLIEAQRGPDEGSLAMCPKHRVPYTEGQYGPYCKQQTDDPAWGKPKGDKLWCRITPKNVDQYLRMQAA